MQLVYRELERYLPQQPQVLNLHDDFTENNTLADHQGIRLNCDWDSHRPSL
ncbi:MAG: hypothetical protein R3F41_14440 [Gammaproteobacteria bacterium]|nr:hypothetical protein [Pseudomonadales bacterium]MCP5347176.1 hypothetical protein [Pseudomonadales bacterium]